MIPPRPTINACFPRSGHRFLRSILQAYFGPAMVFKSVHIPADRDIADPNYVKDHDFGLLNGTDGIAPDPDWRYLVQLRHPLDCLQSYFEFLVEHGSRPDSRDSWDTFVPPYLAYWKAFADKWALGGPRAPGSGVAVHLLSYDALYADPAARAAEAIGFLTGGAAVDARRLERAVERHTGGFARYARDQNKPGGRQERRARDMRAFRYFDDLFPRLEAELAGPYLAPLGLPRKLGG